MEIPTNSVASGNTLPDLSWITSNLLRSLIQRAQQSLAIRASLGNPDACPNQILTYGLLYA
jgi:hypothetical protein